MRRRLQRMGYTVALAALLGGCKPAPPAVPPATGPVRVVSLAPSITEIVCSIGGADQLVGRTTACDVPADVVARVPAIGAFGVPSIERILAVKPGIVLYTDMADESTPRKLSRVGLANARVQCTRLNDIPPAIESVGQCIGRAGDARTLADDLRRRIAAMRTRTTGGAKPGVLVLIWNDPLTAAGRDSFLADLVTLAGGRHIGDSVDRDYFQVASEWVLAQDPEIILCFFMSNNKPVRQTIMQQPGWNRVRAVKSGRVYDGFDNNMVLRPGPRVMDGAERLRRCIAGEVGAGEAEP